MAKFKYRMQNILEIKYKLEEQAKTEYANANEKLRIEELKLEKIYSDINRYEDEIREMNNGRIPLDILRLKWCSESIDIKKYDAEMQKLEIEKARKNVEKARLKLSEVMVDRKTHEKLRERAFEEFKTEVADQERKETDELVSYKFNKAE